jgi:hypothetical protein
MLWLVFVIEIYHVLCEIKIYVLDIAFGIIQYQGSLYNKYLLLCFVNLFLCKRWKDRLQIDTSVYRFMMATNLKSTDSNPVQEPEVSCCANVSELDILYLQ